MGKRRAEKRRSLPTASQSRGGPQAPEGDQPRLDDQHGVPTGSEQETPLPKAVPADRDATSADGSDLGTVLGYINFDGSHSNSNNSSMLVDFKLIQHFRRGKYVDIRSDENNTSPYLGRLVEGPYFVPDYVGLDSSIARLAIQKAALVTVLPDYHAAAGIELLGVIDSRKNLYGLSTRPAPQSAVRAIEGKDLIEMLSLEGNLKLGRLDGYEEIEVNLKGDSKKVLPRNLGIFGTVGSGKTNTSQVLIEQAAMNGWAVIVLDVEGEYCTMNEPQAEPAMLARLAALDMSPKGLSDFAVFHPVAVEADDDIPSTPFSIGFNTLNPYMVAELLGMNDTQEDRFLQLYDACLRSPHAPLPPVKAKSKKAKDGEHALIEKLDESADEPSEELSDEENRFGTSLVDLLEDDPSSSKVTLETLIERVELWMDNNHDDNGKQLTFTNSWGVVRRLLQRLRRLKLFDAGPKTLNMADLLKPGKVSVVNLSNSNESRVNNLVIADILGSVFRFKKANQEPKVMIVIEEAHTFVSRENVKRMRATMDKLREIARRGRKRWLALTFISQQPSHLPAELYELCNNLFVHETKGSKNIDALKGSAGTVNEAIWKDVPTLGQGRAIIISPQFKHPIIAQINPSASKRRLTD